MVVGVVLPALWNTRSDIFYKDLNMLDIKESRVLHIREKGKSNSDLSKILFQTSGIAACDVEVTSEPQDVVCHVQKSLKQNAPFSIVVVNPGLVKKWYVEENFSDLWKIDPFLFVVLLEIGSQEIGSLLTNLNDKRLYRLYLSQRQKSYDHNLKLILTNSYLVRKMSTIQKSIGQFQDLRDKLNIAQNKIEQMNQNLTDTKKNIKYLTSYDPLTKLPNGFLLKKRLASELEQVRKDPGYKFAMLQLNLKRFKVINNSLGREQGDALLVQVSNLLSEVTRSGDTVFRLGGDEFVIVLRKTLSVSNVKRIAQRILHLRVIPLCIDDHLISVTTTIGAVIVSSEQQSDDIMRYANIALSRAKAKGGGRIEFYDPIYHTNELIQLELETDILLGIEREEFFLNYQPIISLADRTIAGFEALIRWKHPTRGCIPPNQFIPISEQNGLIEPLGKWVLQRGCRDLKTILKSGINPSLFMTINISRQQIIQRNFVSDVKNIINCSGINPNQLCLEVTETAMVDELDVVSNNLHDLKILGVRIFIDDFGVGYSSLSSLHKLPVDILKIDRSFVSKMETSDEGKAMVQAIIEVGHALGLSLVAEGVETEWELERVTSMQCEFAQGFYFSPAVELCTAINMLSATYDNPKLSYGS